MPIGQNVNLGDKLIKRTVKQDKPGHQESQESGEKQPFQHPIAGRRTATTNTVKMTFYVKQEFLEKLYNYAYWDRLTVTEAFNTALADGLKGKNTDAVKKVQ
jgi:hypothetical protein